jgi:hypothetical protein
VARGGTCHDEQSGFQFPRKCHGVSGAGNLQPNGGQSDGVAHADMVQSIHFKFRRRHDGLSRSDMAGSLIVRQLFGSDGVAGTTGSHAGDECAICGGGCDGSTGCLCASIIATGTSPRASTGRNDCACRASTG